MQPTAWENHIASTIEARPELQTWRRHLETRLPELRAIDAAAASPEVGDLLEIGCGNGIGSAYFASRAKKIVATDLPAADHAAHSIGLEKANRLFEALGLRDASILGCSAAELPFEDGSFDTILALYSLEHVPDRAEALRECHRVLRPGGKLIAAVPAACWSLTYPLAFYAELGDRAWRRLLKKKAPTMAASASDGGRSEPSPPEKRVVTDWKSFRRVYPHFPLPKPHGEYSSYFDELLSQRPSQWVGLFRAAGFDETSATPLSVVPRGLLTLLLRDLGQTIYDKLLPLERRLCDSPSALPFSQFVCVVGEKR